MYFPLRRGVEGLLAREELSEQGAMSAGISLGLPEPPRLPRPKPKAISSGEMRRFTTCHA